MTPFYQYFFPPSLGGKIQTRRVRTAAAARVLRSARVSPHKLPEDRSVVATVVLRIVFKYVYVYTQYVYNTQSMINRFAGTRYIIIRYIIYTRTHTPAERFTRSAGASEASRRTRFSFFFFYRENPLPPRNRFCPPNRRERVYFTYNTHVTTVIRHRASRGKQKGTYPMCPLCQTIYLYTPLLVNTFFKPKTIFSSSRYTFRPPVPI